MKNLHRFFLSKSAAYAKWHSFKHVDAVHTLIAVFLLIWIAAATAVLMENKNFETGRDQQAAAVSANKSDIPGQYIVMLKPGADKQSIMREHGLNAIHEYSFALNGFAARIPEQALEGLRHNPNVEIIEQDKEIAIHSQSIPAGLSRIGGEESPISKIDGLDERVDADIVVMDTGIDPYHEDLNVIGGYNFTSKNAAAWADDHGHGTHVAGIAAALDNNIGVVGVAPGARLWGFKIFDSSGNGTISTAIKAVDYATSKASLFDVVNMSFGWTGASSIFETAVNNSVAKGIIYIASAGNESRDVYGSDGVYGTADDVIPAAFGNVITVSAMADFDGKPGGLVSEPSIGSYDDSLAGFSNYGSKIDLAAPGVAVYSTLPTTKGRYGSLSGTSMAAPHVTGAAALYIASHGKPYGAQGVAEVRAALVNAAQAQSLWGPADTRDPDSSREPLVLVSNLGQGSSLPPPILGYLPSSIDFGSVKAGSISKRTLHLVNEGSTILYVNSISSNDPAFSLQTNSVSINPGSSADIIVQFAPSRSGKTAIYAAKLSLIHNASNTSSPYLIDMVGTRVK